MKYTLPPLSYEYNALEPYIDAQTMEIHHSKHHQGYIDKLNTALEQYPVLQEKSLSSLLSHLAEIPEDIRETVRNNGGGHYNHTLFWETLSPSPQKSPQGNLLKKIEETFGSLKKVQDTLTQTALNRFGSGWGWLWTDTQGNLFISSTPNQDSPLMKGGIELLGIDVWEHAYYLSYQNRRADYIAAWWQLVDWGIVEKRYNNIIS